MALMSCKSNAAEEMHKGKEAPKMEKSMDAKNAPKEMKAKEMDHQAPKEIVKTDAEWKKELTPEQYRVLRQAATDKPFSKEYEKFKTEGKGTYVCAACGLELFRSAEKFDSHCGWPSFFDPAKSKNVIIRPDLSGGMVREEVICARCKSHLGHIFRGEGFDTPTDNRYCINATSLKFVPDKPAADAPAADDKKMEKK